jgi:serine phosphatase RsbU (regulator of sigma subunit)
MKKIFAVTIAFLFVAKMSQAQFDTNFHFGDSIKKAEATSDVKEKVRILLNIGQNYEYYKGDSAIYYLNIAKDIAIKNEFHQELYFINYFLSGVYNGVLGNYPIALFYSFEMLKHFQILKENGQTIPNQNFDNISASYFTIAGCYAYLGNKSKTNEYLNKYLANVKLDKLSSFYQIVLISNTSKIYNQINDLENAEKFIKKAVKLYDESNSQMSFPYLMYADVLLATKKYELAIDYYKKTIPLAIPFKFYKDVFQSNYGMASAYYHLNKIDSAIYYATEVIKMSKDITFTEGLLKNDLLLHDLYKIKGNKDSALKYIEAAEDLRNTIFNNIKSNDAQSMAINEEIKQAELAEQRAKQEKILIITAIGLILVVVGVYLNGKRKQRERLRQIEEDRKNNELAAARDLQQSMLPKENPKRADLDIATFIRSSTEVGGDYYDFFPQPDGVIYSVCGDATGHGVTSGMMVSVTKAGLNGISPVKPNKILQRLNGVVKRIDLGTLRMSLNIAEITSDEVFLSSAAMPPIYLYKATTKQVEEFMNNGLPLGGLRDEDFVLENRKFEAGDVLVQLSDGLPEAPNLAGEMYDYERLSSLIQSSCHLSAQEIIDVLIKSVDEWMQGKRNPDDITLVVTKKK